MLMKGKFRWLFRKRVRVTLIGDKIYESPTELHDQQLNQLENRFMDCLQERDGISPADQPEDKLKNKRVLATKALNEVLLSVPKILSIAHLLFKNWLNLFSRFL